MKKIPYFILFFLLLCVIVCPSAVVAHAEEGAMENGEEKLMEQIDLLLNELDLSELQNYLDEFAQFKGVSVKEKLKEVLSGDFSINYKSLFDGILSLFWEEVSVLLPAFAMILAITLLCSVINTAKSDILHSSMSDIIYYISYLCVGAIVLSCLISVLNAGFDTVQQMKMQMQLLYPVLLTLMAGSGGVVSASIFRPAVAFLSSGIVELFTSVVFPVAILIIVLSFVGSLSDSFRLKKLSELFQSVCKWLIGLSLGLFSFYLTVQGITSAQYDGISLRAAKYAVSSSVPIVGGFLSGGIELVLAGSAIIKNAVGSFSLFLLVGTIVKPLMLFVSLQLFLRFSAAATESIGGRVSAFLSRLSSSLSYFIAGILCVAFLYFITVLMLVCSSGVIL